MKNYELMSLLMEFPAGYEVEVVQTRDAERIGDIKGVITLVGSIADIDASDASKTITLLT